MNREVSEQEKVKKSVNSVCCPAYRGREMYFVFVLGLRGMCIRLVKGVKNDIIMDTRRKLLLIRYRFGELIID